MSKEELREAMIEQARRKTEVTAKGELYTWAEEAIGMHPGVKREHRVTVRLTGGAHLLLERLGSAMGMSKSGCLEEIAERAIFDLAAYFGLDAIEDPETSGDAAAVKGEAA